MCMALRISKQNLFHLIQQGELSYHFIENGKYVFNQRTYDNNILKYECLSSGGHDYELEKTYGKNKAIYKCKNCSKERYDL